MERSPPAPHRGGAAADPLSRPRARPHRCLERGRRGEGGDEVMEVRP